MMIELTCQAFLFDMDGVLVDSTRAVTRVWAEWAREHNFDPDEVVHRAHGRPSISTIRDFLPHSNHVAENREVERRELSDLDGIMPLPGALELLAAIPRDRWAIVTSCTRKLAEARHQVTGLPLPKQFITADEVTHGKPDPEPYLLAASALGFAPMDCVVVEDVPAGIQAGKAAGARVIALQTTSEGCELAAAGADWIVPDCSAISVISAPNLVKVRLRLENSMSSG